jgi:hypothetical protein
MDRGFSKFLLVLAFTFSVFSCVAPLAAQTRPVSSPLVNPDVQRVARKATLIFTGTVASISPVHSAGSEDINTVEITFQVEQALRGLRTGQRYTIREWSGLWMSGPRYRLGQRMMLFLYGPSRAGLTSPVEGRLGRYDVDRSGQVSISAASALPNPTARPIAAGPQHIPIRTFSRAIRQVMEESR